MKRIEIERKSKVLPADIPRAYLQGVGKPVIITDATENWPARSKWTFEFFKTTYGSDPAKGMRRGHDRRAATWHRRPPTGSENEGAIKPVC